MKVGLQHSQLEDPKFVGALLWMAQVYGFDKLPTKDVLVLAASMFHYYTLRLKDDDK